MSSEVNLMDLPPELLGEILKRCDIYCIDTIGVTCKYMRQRVVDFKIRNPELIADKVMEARGFEAGDNWQDREGYYHGHDAYDDYYAERKRREDPYDLYGSGSLDSAYSRHWRPTYEPDY